MKKSEIERFNKQFNRENAREWRKRWLAEHPGRTSKEYTRIQDSEEVWNWRRAKGEQWAWRIRPHGKPTILDVSIPSMNAGSAMPSITSFGNGGGQDKIKRRLSRLPLPIRQRLGHGGNSGGRFKASRLAECQQLFKLQASDLGPQPGSKARPVLQAIYQIRNDWGRQLWRCHGGNTYRRPKDLVNAPTPAGETRVQRVLDLNDFRFLRDGLRKCGREISQGLLHRREMPGP
jgi:hypothetical protein